MLVGVHISNQYQRLKTCNNQTYHNFIPRECLTQSRGIAFNISDMSASKYRTYISEMYTHKIDEFLSRWKQTQALIKNHNLSVGLICEEIVREFLRKVLPDKVGVTQGFIERNRSLSNQCDIILYDSLNYAPLYSIGGISIIPAEAVFAIIEVKSSFNYTAFGSSLESFKRLAHLGILHKYIFAFQASKIPTIKNYFFRYALRNMIQPTEELYCGDNPIDKTDFEYYPAAIIDIHRNIYLQQDYVQTDERDMFGYSQYEMYNTEGQRISCLQFFVADIISNVWADTNKSLDYQNSITEIAGVGEIRRNGGFGLCDM